MSHSHNNCDLQRLWEFSLNCDIFGGCNNLKWLMPANCECLLFLMTILMSSVLMTDSLGCPPVFRHLLCMHRIASGQDPDNSDNEIWQRVAFVPNYASLVSCLDTKCLKSVLLCGEKYKNTSHFCPGKILSFIVFVFTCHGELWG